MAYNEFGNYTTGCLEVKVLIPHIPLNGTIDGKNLFEWIPLTFPYVITAGLLGVLIYVYIKRKKFGSLRKAKSK